MARTLTENVIVLSAKAWALVDEETKEHKKGTKITYAYDLNQSERQGFKGTELMFASVGADAFGLLTVVPCVAAMDFEFVSNGKGQQLMKPVGVTFIEPLKSAFI